MDIAMTEILTFVKVSPLPKLFMCYVTSILLASDEEEPTDNNPPISTTILTPETPTDSSTSEEPTPSPSPSTSTTDPLLTRNSTTVPLPSSDPSDRPDITVDTSESGNSRTSLPVYVLAGVCGVIVIILTLIAVVVCLIIALVKKSKKSSSAQVERLVILNVKYKCVGICESEVTTVGCLLGNINSSFQFCNDWIF